MALHVTLVRDPLKGGAALKPRVVQNDTVSLETVLGYMATDTALEATDMREAPIWMERSRGWRPATWESASCPPGHC